MKIILDSGIEIALLELNQKCIYEHLLEGLPTKEMNANIIKELLTEHCSWDTKPYLIEPVEIPTRLGVDYPFGKAVRIPPIACIGRFESDYARKERFLHRTTAKVIWFQSDFALPIEEHILKKIRSMDWPLISTEYEL